MTKHIWKNPCIFWESIIISSQLWQVAIFCLPEYLKTDWIGFYWSYTVCGRPQSTATGLTGLITGFVSSKGFSLKILLWCSLHTNIIAATKEGHRGRCADCSAASRGMLMESEDSFVCVTGLLWVWRSDAHPPPWFSYFKHSTKTH